MAKGGDGGENGRWDSVAVIGRGGGGVWPLPIASSISGSTKIQFKKIRFDKFSSSPPEII